MVRTWAEKEMRNLRRLHRVGIPCPEPFFHKAHIIVMGFIGSDGKCVLSIGSDIQFIFLHSWPSKRDLAQVSQVISVLGIRTFDGNDF